MAALRNIARLFVIAAAVPAIAGCGEAKGDETHEARKPVSPVVKEAQPLEIEPYFDATGHAQADIMGLAKAVCPLAGVVEKILIGVGGQVKKGEPLAVINSADICDLYSSYLSNKAQLHQAERLYELNKELFEKGIVTKADFLTAEGSYRQVQASIQGQEAKMKQYGVTPAVCDLFSSYLSNKAQLPQAERRYELNKELFEKGIVTKADLLTAEGNYRQVQASIQDQEAKMKQYGVSPADGCVKALTISAPINGFVAELYVHIGDRTDSTGAVALIANPEEMLIVADLHDVDLPALGGKNSIVRFKTDVPPVREWKGVITYVSDVQDPDTKTIKVYIKIQGNGFQFRQNMFFKIRFFGEKKTLPTVPKSALIYRDNKFFVSVMKGDKPTLKEVRPFRDVDAQVAVEGLEVNEKVVVSAMDQEAP